MSPDVEMPSINYCKSIYFDALRFARLWPEYNLTPLKIAGYVHTSVVNINESKSAFANFMFVISVSQLGIAKHHKIKGVSNMGGGGLQEYFIIRVL